MRPLTPTVVILCITLTHDTKERLWQLVDFAAEIGALDRIAVFEEPFPAVYKVDVADLPVTMAVDESVHSVQDVACAFAEEYAAGAKKMYL
ncbi:MAG TPA: hypothetical protein GXX57_11165 [Firmicutes bacterium]|jgi:L-alanine-DL-glutamate epimerase-like enolase superfamily enzyme|nr:hypothetical protein [Bacillota bacterium]